MRLRLTTCLVILAFTGCFGQTKVRLPIWTFNTKNTDIYGLAVGYTTTKRIKAVNTNGVRFELIGLGILLPLMPGAPIAENDSLHDLYLNTPFTEKINGINLSPLGIGCDCKVNGLNLYGAGSITGQVNGVSAGLFINVTEKQNGLQGSIFFNITYELNGIQAAFVANENRGLARGLQIAASNKTRELKGVQIGLYNKTTKIKGIQIGLWNVNEKRSRPIINF